MRGEHVDVDDEAQSQKGSSPHARGAHTPVRLIWRLPGIIPACAGSTASRRSGSSTRGDHPRMRGEHIATESCEDTFVGSSPHARGAPSIGTGLSGEGGIIPACAGSTPCSRIRLWTPRDHPRMRGEHQHPDDTLADEVGSSPHARGAPAKNFVSSCQVGIIPACAGSTDA